MAAIPKELTINVGMSISDDTARTCCRLLHIWLNEVRGRDIRISEKYTGFGMERYLELVPAPLEATMKMMEEAHD